MKLLRLGKGDEELWKLGADQFMGLINAIMESLKKEHEDREMNELMKQYGFEGKSVEDVKFVHYAGHAEDLAYYLLALNQPLDRLPPPASSFMIEYYTDLEDEVYTRFFLNEELLKVCGEEEFCSSNELHQFLHTRNKYYLKGHVDIKQACWNAWMEGKRGFDLPFTA